MTTRTTACRTKLFFQTAAAVLVVGEGDWIGVGGALYRPGELPGGAAGAVVAIVWLVGITNALNFLDGLDGLAAGSSAMMAGTLALVAARHGYVADDEWRRVASVYGSKLGELTVHKAMSDAPKCRSRSPRRRRSRRSR